MFDNTKLSACAYDADYFYYMPHFVLPDRLTGSLNTHHYHPPEGFMRIPAGRWMEEPDTWTPLDSPETSVGEFFDIETGEVILR